MGQIFPCKMISESGLTRAKVQEIPFLPQVPPQQLHTRTLPDNPIRRLKRQLPRDL